MALALPLSDPRQLAAAATQPRPTAGCSLKEVAIVTISKALKLSAPQASTTACGDLTTMERAAIGVMYAAAFVQWQQRLRQRRRWTLWDSDSEARAPRGLAAVPRMAADRVETFCSALAASPRAGNCSPTCGGGKITIIGNEENRCAENGTGTHGPQTIKGVIGSVLTLPLGLASPVQTNHILVVACRTLAESRVPKWFRLSVGLFPSSPLSPTPLVILSLAALVLVIASGMGPGGTRSTPRTALLLGACSGFHMALASSPAPPSAAAAATAVLSTRSAELHGAATLEPPTVTLDSWMASAVLYLSTALQLEGGSRRLGRWPRNRRSMIGVSS